MRILLVNPACDPRTIGLRHMAKIEPLGLETIGAAVPQHDVRLVDMEVAPEDLEATLDRFAPDIVGVTSEIVHVATALQVVHTVRARYPDCLIVIGGHHATMRPEDFADPAVDVVVVGEGVVAFRELCAIHEVGGDDFSKVAGLALPQSDGTVKRTPPRPQPTDLDAYPMPDRSLTAAYRHRYFYVHEARVAAVRTSFGCTHHCTFCSVRVYSQGLHISRSAEQVFEEIQSIDEDFIMFCDDHSFLDAERMRVLGTRLLEAGVKKRYFAYARADSIVAHTDVFELWAKVGLKIVMTGLEAIDAKALKRAGKQTSVDTNEQAIRICERLGVGISAGFLVEPEFTREDFERIDEYARARPSIAIVEYTALTPLPGTPLYRKECERLLTHDPALFDLQHFVLPTKLPTRELYALMLEYHRRSSLRFIRRLLRHQPSVFLSPHALRLIPGLLANASAYREAHLVAPDRRMDDSVPSTDTATGPARITYQGWSDWRAQVTGRPPLLIDPAPDVEFPEQPAVVVLTHGHPEHIERTLAQLGRPQRPPLTVVASKALCQYLEARSSPNARDRFCAIAAGEDRQVEGWNLHAFGWTHMPLMPPEPRLAVRHILSLLRRPVQLFGIVRDGLAGAPAGPMLGYVLSGSGLERPVVFYGEGLHRQTAPEAIRRIVGAHPEALLIAGLEPEDVDRVPGLLATAGVREAVFFEPHGPWRDSFGLAQLSPQTLSHACDQLALQSQLVRPGGVNVTALSHTRNETATARRPTA